jgi:hypothetical protein
MSGLRAATLAIVLGGAMMAPGAAWGQPPQRAELQVPIGQIEAFCNDFRQAFDQCVTQKGVPVASGQPLTDDQIRARRACRQEIDDEFDPHTASFCPHPSLGVAAADYAAMCVELNQRSESCLEEFEYHALVGEPIEPESYAYLRHFREQAGADMTVARYCGPPAYRSAP